jgi:hypothetical protein
LRETNAQSVQNILHIVQKKPANPCHPRVTETRTSTLV